MAESRKIAAILAADVVGFSRLASADEDRTLARLRALRAELIDPAVASQNGRVFKRTGDGALVEFRSVVEAVRCAISIQSAMIERNVGISADQRIEFRIGIHLGDVVEESDGDLMGDGVNIAARLEGVARPGAICLSEQAYWQVKARLDIAVSDLGAMQLKNIAEPVHAFSLEVGLPARAKPAGQAGPTPAQTPAERLSAPAKPSIAVLPFQNMSGDAEQDFFCDGLVEDIITTLSKLAGLRVIARNSTFVYKGRSVDVREAAKQLGVRYVLEGSVRKSGSRIRVTAQLIDATDGSHLWAERYDRAVDDIFAIQDEITLVLATEMQVMLTDGEQARLRYTTTDNVEAWTYWVKGLSHYRQPPTKDNREAAQLCWEKALALDANSAPLNAMLGFMHCLDARFGWKDTFEIAKGKARAYADRALELDPDNADAHVTSGLVLLIEGRHDEAMASARNAVKLAPGSAEVAHLAGFTFIAAGRPDEAVALCERSMTLSPNYPAMVLGTLGDAYRQAGRTDEAIAAFEAYHVRSPGFGLTDVVIACQEKGQPEEARRTAARLMAARPGFTIAGWRKTQFLRRDQSRVDADEAALRAAGLPSG
ncbi:MAG: adenylate/guanylate cyclase domain-containing protein [Roseiarcus sp.]